MLFSFFFLKKKSATPPEVGCRATDPKRRGKVVERPYSGRVEDQIHSRNLHMSSNARNMRKLSKIMEKTLNFDQINWYFFARAPEVVCSTTYCKLCRKIVWSIYSGRVEDQTRWNNLHMRSCFHHTMGWSMKGEKHQISVKVTDVFCATSRSRMLHYVPHTS